MARDSRRSNREGTIFKIKGRPGYRAQVTLLDGSRPTKQCRTIQEANDWIGQQQALDRMGQRRATSTTTLDEWATRWFSARAGHVAPRTVANEWSHYHRYFGPLSKKRLEHLTAGHIQDWLLSIERAGLASKPGTGRPHTTRLCFSLLSVMMRDALNHELIGANPMTGVKRPKVPAPEPKFLTRIEVDRLIAAVDDTGDPRAFAVHLMLRLGLRRNEALGLTWGDVDLRGGTLEVVFQLGRVPAPRGLGGTVLVRRELKTLSSRRQLKLFGDVLEDLTHLYQSRVEPGDDTFVISLVDGYPVDPDAFSHWLAALGRRIGVVVSPHRLRHTSATLMLNGGVSIEAVGKVLGHTDIKTTGVYARVLDETGSAALETLANDLDRVTRNNLG
jgi:integrase